MAILNVFRVGTGSDQVVPGDIRIQSTDNLDTITQAGYLNSNWAPSTFLPTDVASVSYNNGNNMGVFFLSFDSNGIITLNDAAVTGDVQLPVTEGHFVNFIGTSGSIGDLGYFPSDSTKSLVTMAGTVTNVGDIPVFADTNGTLGNVPRITPSNPASQYVCMQYNTSVVGNIPLYYDSNGTLKEAGITPSDPTATTIAMVDNPIQGSYVVFADNVGTIGSAALDESFSQASLSVNQTVSFPTSNTTINFDTLNFDSGIVTLSSGIFTSTINGVIDIQLQITGSNGPVNNYVAINLYTNNGSGAVVVSQSYLYASNTAPNGNTVFLQFPYQVSIGYTFYVTCVSIASGSITILGSLFTNIFMRLAG